MAFTTGNDVNILQTSDNAIVGAGAGNDKYILSAANVAANQQITLSDAAGTNTLQLMGGLTIASSKVAADTVQLTLSNGAVVTVLGASTFSYEIAGDPLSGVAGTVQTYSAFVTTTLGAASVPTTGTVSGTANVTIPGGSTGTTAGQAFSLTTATETKSLTSGNDTVDGSVANSLNNDTLVDTSGTDVLNAVITANATAIISDIETINLDFKGFNLAFTGTNVSNGNIVVSSSQAYNDKATITGLSTKAANVEVTSTIKNLTLGGSAGTTDATTVKLAGGDLTLTTNSTNAIEMVGLNSTGSAANVVTLTSATTAETFNVTGDKSLTLKVAAANITTDTVTKSLTGNATLEVQLTTTSADTDLKKVAATKFTTASSGNTALGANAITFAAGTTTLELNEASLVSSVAANKGFIADGSATTDVLNMVWNKAQGVVKTEGFETVNLTNATGANLALTTGTAHTIGTAGTLNLFGAYDVDMVNTGGTLVAKAVDASAMTGTGKLTVHVANNSANSVTVTGTANADSITVDQTTADKTATINAGDGNNTIVATTSSQKITINTGTGNDTITAGSGADVIISGAGNDTLTLTKGDNYAVTEDGNDSITLGTGKDAVIAGAGDDAVIGGLNVTADDTMAGGDGSDTLTMGLAAAATYSLTFGSNFNGFEAISLSGGTQTKGYTIKTNDANVASGTEMTVTVGALKAAFTFDGSAELDGKFKLTTGASTATTGVVVKGGAGADSLTIGNAGGAATVNLITGGKGGDAISFGTGTYTNVFAKGDGLVVTSAADGMSVSGADVLTGLGASDKLSFASIYPGSVTATVSTTMPAALVNGGYYIVDGTYDSATKKFTAGSASDAMIIIDTDNTTGTNFEAIVLIGVDHTKIGDLTTGTASLTT